MVAAALTQCQTARPGMESIGKWEQITTGAADSIRGGPTLGCLAASKALILGMAVIVEWLGHCSFRLISGDGIRILIDPFDDTIGYKVPPYDCNILLISHHHYDSAARHLVPPGYSSADSKGTTLAGGVQITALPWWHDERQGKDFGSVLIFLFELDGLKCGYLSHIGSVPRRWMLEQLGGLDLCFLPVGGIFALGPRDAKYIVEEIKPRLIVPMHYQTRALSFSLLPLSEFTKLMPEIREESAWRVEVRKDDLPENPTVLLMHHWPGAAP